MGVYAVSDLHGQKDLWEQIKAYLKPEDKLYCLGDCVDRGNYGFDILVEVLNRPNTEMIKGNHEDLMLKYYCHNMKVDQFSLFANLWFNNGGHYTVFNMENYPIPTIDKILEQVRALPLMTSYVNAAGQKIILDHSGFTIDFGQDDPMWNRSHFSDSWPKDEKWQNIYIIHGHTPVVAMGNYNFNGIENSYINKKDPEILRYCGGHKINIDLGCFATNKTCLLNLDTLEPIYFTQEPASEIEYIW